MSRFDAIIIGAGQAGPPLAGRLTQAGMTVAMIERKLFGGTCVNTGCMPTKTLVASAYAAHLARRAPTTASSRQRDSRRHATGQGAGRAVVGERAPRRRKWLHGMNGCRVLVGHARFETPDTVRVGDELLTAPRIFINVGGRANVPDFPRIGEVPYLTNSSMLALDRAAGTSGHRRWQLHRSRVRADVSTIRRRRDRRRKDAAADRPRGPRHFGSHRDILVREGIAVRTAAECITVAPHEKGVAVGVECRRRADDRRIARLARRRPASEHR